MGYGYSKPETDLVNHYDCIIWNGTSVCYGELWNNKGSWMAFWDTAIRGSHLSRRGGDVMVARHSFTYRFTNCTKFTRLSRSHLTSAYLSKSFPKPLLSPLVSSSSIQRH